MDGKLWESPLIPLLAGRSPSKARGIRKLNLHYSFTSIIMLPPTLLSRCAPEISPRVVNSSRNVWRSHIYDLVQIGPANAPLNVLTCTSSVQAHNDGEQGGGVVPICEVLRREPELRLMNNPSKLIRYGERKSMVRTQGFG